MRVMRDVRNILGGAFRIIALALAFAFVLVFVSCSAPDRDDSDYPDYSDDNIIQVVYTYPENPVSGLKSFLESDIAERGLSMEIGKVERVYRGGKERREFEISFTGGSDNACVVSFNAGNDRDSQSFLLGFKNAKQSWESSEAQEAQEMIEVLSSVLLYISPDLSLEEAKRLAVRQYETISPDGLSIPQDVGAYQVQAHFDNNFVASMGITITALKHIWGGDIFIDQYRVLNTERDFNVLKLYPPLGNAVSEETAVCAEFIVKSYRVVEEPMHSDITAYIEAESPYGEMYTLCLDPTVTPYAFGIGEKYTFFISPNRYGARIIYAVQ